MKLGTRVGAIQSQILVQFLGQPKVYHLANQALTVLHTFVQRLITFIDSTNNNLCHVSRFQEKQAWALTMALVDRILADLYAPKSGVHSVLQVQDREDACSQLLWTRLGCLSVAQEYLKFEFKDHPAIASEYVKFLTLNSGSDKLDQAEKDLSGITSEVAKTSKELVTVKSKADTASGKVAKLGSDLKKLVARVSVLEKN